MFNGSSTPERKVNLCYAVGGWKLAERARMHNNYIKNYNVTQFTVKHSIYTKTTTSYLIIGLTSLIIALMHSYDSYSI